MSVDRSPAAGLSKARRNSQSGQNPAGALADSTVWQTGHRVISITNGIVGSFHCYWEKPVRKLRENSKNNFKAVSTAHDRNQITNLLLHLRRSRHRLRDLF